MYSYRKNVIALDLVPAMQRHADYARRGYVHAVTGSVESAKALALARKFDSIYGTHASRRERERARNEGVARSVLLLYTESASGRFTSRSSREEQRPTKIGFTLLVTDGDHPVQLRERPILITDEHTRLRIGQWELVRRTRPGRATPSWTWAMHREVYQDWRERLLRSARGDAVESPHALLVELYGGPGFAGVRSQVGHLVAWYRRSWRRYQGAHQAFPRLPRLYYAQRLPNTGYLLGRKS